MLSHYDGRDALIERLLEGPYRIVDVLPEQVPGNAGGQYAAVDRYYRRPDRLGDVYRRYGEILLRLNCYEDMEVAFDGGESWEINPDPAPFAEALEQAGSRGVPGFLRAVFPDRGAMIDLDFGDTWMTVYDPEGGLTDRLGRLAGAEGFFLWQPEEGRG